MNCYCSMVDVIPTLLSGSSILKFCLLNFLFFFFRHFLLNGIPNTPLLRLDLSVMTQAKSVSEHLLSQGTNNFVILSSSGDVIESCGDFSNAQKQTVAAALLVQIPSTLRDGETVRRVSMTFPNAVYVATAFGGENDSDAFGVVCTSYFHIALLFRIIIIIIIIINHCTGKSQSSKRTIKKAKYRGIRRRLFILVLELRIQLPWSINDTHTDYLLPGKNVIGRGSVELEGVSFVEISSPNSSVSRVQANIEICPNGDAWICDCNSTNGTFISINDGPGVCLEQQHYYQLSDGCHIFFGDVERTFKRITSESVRRVNSGVKDANEGVVRASTELRHRKNSSDPAPKSRTIDPSTPYLAEEDARSDTGSPSPGSKRPSSGPSSSVEPFEIIACLSGMDADEREEAKKAIRPHGRIVDDIRKATVLVVRLPAVRTPKFIIAAGRGIPIVSVESFREGPVTLAKLNSDIVSLKHEKLSYSSDVLRATICRKNRAPLLAGQTFGLQRLPAKSRDVARDVVLGCGGAVAKGRANANATELDENNLNTFYDSILRGKLSEDLHACVVEMSLLRVKRARSNTPESGKGSCSSCLHSSGSQTTAPASNPSSIAARQSTSEALSSDSENAYRVSEISLLQRHDDNIADMCMFVVKTLNQLGSTTALKSFVSYLSTTGVKRCMYALKQAGTEDEMMDVLFHTKLLNPLCKPLQLAVAYHLLTNSESQLLGQRSAANFFLSFCNNQDNMALYKTGTGELVNKEKPRHWSTPRKKSVAPENDAELSCTKEAAQHLCRMDQLPVNLEGECDACALAVWCLKKLLTCENEVSSWRLGSMHAAVVDAQGINILSRLVNHSYASHEFQRNVLQLLELLTAFPSVSVHPSDLSLCVQEVTDALQQNADSFSAETSCLHKLGTYFRGILVSPKEGDQDLPPFVLCCTINILKRECCKQAGTPFTASLLKNVNEEKIFSSLMRNLFCFYNSTATEDVVLAGYYAIIVGMLSLIEIDGEELRIPVITAISKCNAECVQQSLNQPMSVIVAVIQEFLLFQSRASTLCSTAFIEKTKLRANSQCCSYLFARYFILHWLIRPLQMHRKAQLRDSFEHSLLAQLPDMSVKVAVRCRPFSVSELQEGAETAIFMDATRVNVRYGGHQHTFCYDEALCSVEGSSNVATQETVYEAVAAPLLGHVLTGYNGCIFAYGQTGSGKTYSMIGSDSQRGLIPRIAESIFNEVPKLHSSGIETCLEVSFFEIYNEKVRCLLRPTSGGFEDSSLRVREHPTFGPFIEGLAKFVVSTKEECLSLLEDGHKVRSTASTAMNAVSSRSHAVFTITLTQTKTNGAVVTNTRAKNIVNVAVVNESNNDEVVAALQKEIESLQAALKSATQTDRAALMEEIMTTEAMKRQLDTTMADKLAETKRMMEEREGYMRELEVRLRSQNAEIEALRAANAEKEKQILQLLNAIQQNRVKGGVSTIDSDLMRIEVAELERQQRNASTSIDNKTGVNRSQFSVGMPDPDLSIGSTDGASHHEESNSLSLVDSSSNGIQLNEEFDIDLDLDDLMAAHSGNQEKHLDVNLSGVSSPEIQLEADDSLQISLGSTIVLEESQKREESAPAPSLGDDVINLDEWDEISLPGAPNHNTQASDVVEASLSSNTLPQEQHGTHAATVAPAIVSPSGMVSVVGVESDKLLNGEFLALSIPAVVTFGSLLYGPCAIECNLFERRVKILTVHGKLIDEYPVEQLHQFDSTRSRFIAHQLLALAGRNAIMWSPALCNAHGATEMKLIVHGTTIKRQGVPAHVKGDATLHVSKLLYEVYDFWYGCFSLDFGALPKNPAVLNSFLPEAPRDLYVIGTVNVLPSMVDSSEIGELFLNCLGAEQFQLVNLMEVEASSTAKRSSVLTVICRKEVFTRLQQVRLTRFTETEKSIYGAIACMLVINQSSMVFLLVHDLGTDYSPKERNAALRSMIAGLSFGDNNSDSSVRFDYFLVSGTFQYKYEFTDKDLLLKHIKSNNLLSDFTEMSPSNSLKRVMKPSRIFTMVQQHVARMQLYEYSTSRALSSSCYIVGDIFCQRHSLSLFTSSMLSLSIELTGTTFKSRRLPSDIREGSIQISGEVLDGYLLKWPLSSANPLDSIPKTMTIPLIIDSLDFARPDCIWGNPFEALHKAIGRAFELQDLFVSRKLLCGNTSGNDRSCREACSGITIKTEGSEEWNALLQTINEFF
eukprot:gene4427-3226_t